MTDSVPLIELRDIDLAFGTNVIFTKMALAVYPGECLSVLGESGMGKSLCLKMMVGLQEPDAGEVLIRGRNINEYSADELVELRREISYVFQEDALFDSMTVLENVGYYLIEHTRQSDEEIRERCRVALESVGLHARNLDLMPANLSGGMRKRVGLARSIVFDPPTVLFDDPTRGLDPISITRIGTLLEKRHEDSSRTSVLATHDLKTALKVSNRLAVLHDRKFPFEGTLEELRKLDHPDINDFLHDPDEDLQEQRRQARSRKKQFSSA